MASVGQPQTLMGFRVVPPREPLVPVGPPVYFTNPQALLSSKHTGPVYEMCKDEIHNWSAYLMSYDKVLANTSRWHRPVLAWAELPDPNDRVRGISHNFLILDETWDQPPDLFLQIRERIDPRVFYNQMMGEPFEARPDPEVERQRIIRERIREIMERQRRRNEAGIYELPRPVEDMRFIDP